MSGQKDSARRAGAAKAEPAGKQPSRPGSKRRRWSLWVGAPLIILAALMWLSPYLLSTGLGARLLLAIVNPRLEGEIRLRELSLAWISPCEAEGLTFLDAQGRKVFQAKRIRYRPGLWHAIWKREDFEHIRLEHPRAILHLPAKTTPTAGRIPRAVRGAAPQRVPPQQQVGTQQRPGPTRQRGHAEAAPRKLPQPRGRIVIRSGSVRLVLADGDELDISDIDARLELRGLNNLTANFALTLPDGAEVGGELRLRGLARGGRLSPGQAQGELDVRTDGPTELAPLAELLGQRTLRGQAELALRAAFRPGEITADFQVKLSQFAAPHLAQAAVKPIDLAAKGRLALRGQAVAAEVKLAGRPGRIQARADFRRPLTLSGPEPTKLVPAMMTGQAMGLPEFNLSVAGRVDLAALAEAVPALLRLRRDVELTGGVLRMDDVRITGGPSPSARGRIGITALRARRAGRTIALQPIQADFDLLLKPGKGLTIRRALLQADFARLEASGTPQSMRAAFSADLSRLHSQLSEILQLGELKLGGQLSSTLAMSRSTEARVDFDLRAECSSVDVRLGNRGLQGDRAMVAGSGYLDLRQRKLRRVTVTKGQIRLDPALEALGRGYYDLTTGGFQAAANVRRADLGYLNQRIWAAKSGRGGRLAGTITSLQATARRAQKGAEITSTGQASLANLAVDGRPLADGKLALNWSDIRIEPARKHLAAREIKLGGTLLNAVISDLACRYGAARSLDGHLALDADLAGCLRGARPWLGKAGASLPDLKGRVRLQGLCRTRDNEVHFEGSAAIRDKATAPVLAASGKGLYQTHTRALDAEVRLERADLAYLSRYARPPRRWLRSVFLGTLSGQARLTRAPGREAMIINGSARGRGLAVDGKPLGDGQLELRWDGVRVLAAKRELSVRSLHLTASMARATLEDVRVQWGQPPAAEAKVELSANLDECFSAAAPLVKTKRPPRLEGVLALRGRFRSAAGKVHFRADTRITAPQAEPRALPPLAVTANGWVEPRTGGLAVSVNVGRAELAYLARQARALGQERLEGWEGTATANARLARADRRGPIATSGGATVTNLLINGQRASKKDVALRWNDLRIWLAESRIAAATVSLDSTPASLSAQAVRCSFGPRFDLAGRVDLRADIAACLAVAGPIAKWKAVPPVAGRLNFTGSARSAGRTITYEGTGTLNDFRYGTGPKALRERRVDFTSAGGIDARAEVISLRQLRISSGLLTATAAGTVSQFRTRRVLDLQGHYQADWDRLTALLHARRPDLAGRVAFAGQSAGDFRLLGPINDPKANPPWRGLQATTKVTWQSGRLFGIVLGEAELSPALADGRLTLPVAVITARQVPEPARHRPEPTTRPGQAQAPAGGKVRLGGVVDFTTAEAVWRLERLKVLEDVPLSVEVGELLLSHLNPIFAKVNVARLDGRATLVLYRPARQRIPAAGVWIDQFALPLSAAIKRHGTGAGELTLSTVTLQPRGLGGAMLRRLLELGGIEATDRQPLRLTGGRFFIAKGRIWYKGRDFTIHFGEEFDLQFSGSVGLDGTLDLTAWVPVRAALLKRMRVRGPIAAYARYLEGERVGIPIRGTRQQPRLELSAVDLGPLIRRAAAAILAEQLRRQLEGRGARTRPATQPATAPAPTTRPAGEELINDLFDLLRGAGRRKQR